MSRRSPLVSLGVAGARETGLPEKIRASLATLVDDAPTGDDWVHEVKFDGYRILAAIEGKAVRLVSRNNHRG